MTPKQTKTSENMTSIKSAWDKAPAGQKKDDALKHYQASEKSNKENNEIETNRHLDAAKLALA